MYERLSHLEDSEPDIISVGDSSGFFSLQSTIVNRYTNGLKFLSLNTGANQAFIGYQAIAEYMLRRSSHIKYIVLYLYPQLVPSDIVLSVADLGPITYEDLVSLKSSATPPSAFLSPYAKALLFAGQHFHAGDPPNNHMPSLQLASTVDDALGWLPEFDVRIDRVNYRVPFYPDTRSDWSNLLGLGDPSSAVANLNLFYDMVRRHGARLVVAFAPMPSRALVPGDPNVHAIDRALARFQSEHPDVKLLFPFVTRWGSEKFGMFNHISREYTFLSSERLGRALGRLATDPDSIPPYEARFQDPDSLPSIEAKTLGPPDPSLLKPALALYLYTSTVDEQYRRLISKRVSALLARERAYGFMMEDAQARNASLAKRGIKIGFDLSQLHATPVQVTGMSSCNAGAGIEWVQIDGTIIFTYTAPGLDSREPVVWPKGSHIYIPTVLEDGVRKFDGYCPEPSMSDAAADKG
ncbi:MAG TPA: hypothetical protein VFC38_07180 [Stellaceae bacterium]|nr:hypothetical protein [Stellaceae bacterium]